MRGAVATLTKATGIKTLRMRDGWTYTFNSFSELIEIADRNGNKLTFERRHGSPDEGGYLTSITTAEGGQVTLQQTYLAAYFYRTDSITDPLGRQVKYTYEDDPFSIFPRLKSVLYPDGSAIQYQYDSLGRMSGIINGRGILEVVNEYFPDNPEDPYQKYRIYKQTYIDGGTYIFDYTVAGGYVTQTNMAAPNGAVTTWRFNNYSYITEKITPDGSTVYELEPATNLMLSVTDPLQRTKSHTFYDNGLVHTEF